MKRTKEENKAKFIEIYKQHITREGADKLLEHLLNSSFFDDPASTKFHGAYSGGLCEHSINVYECLKAYMERPRVKNEYLTKAYSDESIAVVALLHDLCKCGVYTTELRNVKVNGNWETVPFYKYEDNLPFGHGEKSVYIISAFMKLTREEAFAIRYHMGFSSANSPQEVGNVGKAFEMFPLAFAASVADMEATYFIESREEPMP